MTFTKHIIEKLIGTIEKIRIKRKGMVCTSLIMEKAKDITEMEMAKNKKAEDEEIKMLVVGMLLHILINNMQGEEFDEVFGDDSKRKKKADKNKKKKPSTSDLSETGATGTAADLKSKSDDLIVLPI